MGRFLCVFFDNLCMFYIYVLGKYMVLFSSMFLASFHHPYFVFCPHLFSPICSIFFTFIYTHSISARERPVFCSDASFLGHGVRRVFSCYLLSLDRLPWQIYLLTSWGTRLLVSTGSLGCGSLHAHRGDATRGSAPLVNEDIVTASWLHLGKCDFHGF